MVVDPTTTADWLTAIGTVGAVVVALALSIIPGVRRWYRRPVLHLEFGTVEPLVRMDLAPTEQLDIGGAFNGTTLVRARVRNTGRSEAHRVRVHVQAWWVLDRGRWRRFDLDPVLLRWVSQRSETEVDIAPQLDDLVEVVSMDRSGRHALAIDLEPRPHFNWQSHTACAEHRIELVAYGDGADSTRAVIEYKFGAEHGVEAREAERPPDDEVMDLGLMSLTSGLSPDNFALDSEDDDTDTEADPGPSEL